MKTSLFPILCLVLFVSCKKHDTTVDLTPQLLMRTWKLYSQDVITPLQGTALNGTSQHWYGPDYAPGCYSKMLWTFQADNNVKIQDDAACIPSGTNGINLNSWRLSNKNKSLDINGSTFGTFTYSIISLTESKLIVQRQQKVGYSNGGLIDLLIQYEYDAQ
jgi:hypothetical protein